MISSARNTERCTAFCEIRADFEEEGGGDSGGTKSWSSRDGPMTGHTRTLLGAGGKPWRRYVALDDGPEVEVEDDALMMAVPFSTT